MAYSIDCLGALQQRVNLTQTRISEDLGFMYLQAGAALGYRRQRLVHFNLLPRIKGPW